MGPTRDDDKSERRPCTSADSIVSATVMSLHTWLKAHRYNYSSINSIPRLGPLDHLLDRVCSLGIVWRQLFRLCPFDCRRFFGGTEVVEDPEATILLARAYERLDWAGGATFHTPAAECWQRLLKLGTRADGVFAVPQRRRIRTLNYSTQESDVSPLLTAWAGAAFLTRYRAVHEAECLDGAARVAAYFLRHHPREVSDQGVYFYYVPQMPKRVFNASAEMSAFLAEYGALSGDREAWELGWRGMRFVVHHQNAEGSWFYGGGRSGRYIDNFHTAFVLWALFRVLQLKPDPSFAAALRRGLRYYVSRLFQAEREGLRPVRYDPRYRPLNSTILQHADLRDCAVSILLFCQLAGQDLRYAEMAQRVLAWTIARMHRGPWFHPEILRYGKNHNPYINFQAWMLFALAALHQPRSGVA